VVCLRLRAAIRAGATICRYRSYARQCCLRTGIGRPPPDRQAISRAPGVTRQPRTYILSGAQREKRAFFGDVHRTWRKVHRIQAPLPALVGFHTARTAESIVGQVDSRLWVADSRGFQDVSARRKTSKPGRRGVVDLPPPVNNDRRTLSQAAKPIIGIVGGIGAGKSTVASMLAELGAAVVDADRLNHEELNSPEVLATVRQWWGGGVVGADGRADRDAIRRIVRGRPEELRRLEALVHPRIAERSETLIRAYRADPNVRAIVWDAPLLVEVGLAGRCDCVVYVDTNPDVRLNRLRQSRSWSDEDLQRMESSQKPLDLKRERADYIVENGSDRESLRRQVERVFSQILSGT
jgi:dephospho-CoA kinase